jgi:hypothetical protein
MTVYDVTHYHIINITTKTKTHFKTEADIYI